MADKFASRADPAGSPTGEEQRRVRRQRVLKGARIVINEKASSFDAMIRDMSELGVKLKVHEAWRIPDRFYLVIANSNTGVPVTRACEKRWQRGDYLGARFCDAVLPSRRAS